MYMKQTAYEATPPRGETEQFLACVKIPSVFSMLEMCILGAIRKFG
jgi:hypothetical protein